ncbi:hypothetical protein SEHO0A_01610 [Salmonella enterica subsp. houtenae str. ATCC BAA-1581]|nr:hypothetical protein SEHO0A_01610 [Salmonella enterica subsp. houtenae str. ATCC BAA-1581]
MKLIIAGLRRYAAAPEFQLSPSLLNEPGCMMYTVDNIRR